MCIYIYIHVFICIWTCIHIRISFLFVCADMGYRIKLEYRRYRAPGLIQLLWDHPLLTPAGLYMRIYLHTYEDVHVCERTFTCVRSTALGPSFAYSCWSLYMYIFVHICRCVHVWINMYKCVYMQLLWDHPLLISAGLRICIFAFACTYLCLCNCFGSILCLFLLVNICIYMCIYIHNI